MRGLVDSLILEGVARTLKNLVQPAPLSSLLSFSLPGCFTSHLYDHLPPFRTSFLPYSINSSPSAHIRVHPFLCSGFYSSRPFLLLVSPISISLSSFISIRRGKCCGVPRRSRQGRWRSLAYERPSTASSKTISKVLLLLFPPLLLLSLPPIFIILVSQKEGLNAWSALHEAVQIRFPRLLDHV